MPFIPDTQTNNFGATPSFIPDSGNGPAPKVPLKEESPSLFKRYADFSQPALDFVGNTAKSIAMPFAEAAASAVSAAEGVGSLITGLGREEADRALNEGYNVPGLGQVKPVSIDEPKRVWGTGAQIASTLVGGGATKNVIGQTAKGAIKQAAKTGLIEGAASGAAAGFGGAVQADDASLKSVAKSTLEGAAVGGALGAAIPAAGAAVKGTRTVAKGVKNTLVPDKITETISAIKPGVNNKAFKKDLESVFDNLSVSELDEWKDLPSMSRTLETKKAQIWDQVKNALKVGQEQQLKVDGTKAANAIREVLDNPKLRRENPALLERIAAKAKSYEDDIDVMEAENIIEQTNAELASYYRKNNTSRAEVLKANPELAADIKLVETLRKELDDILDAAETGGFADLKKMYGSFANVSKEVARRIPVAERQNLTSLAEQISFAQGVGKIGKSVANMQMGDAISGAAQMISSNVLKNRESSNAKIARAASKAIKEKLKKQAIK